MANVDVISKTFLAYFLTKWRQNNIWPLLVRDWTAEKGRFGNELSLPTDGTSYNLTADTISEQYGTDASKLQFPTPDVVTANRERLEIDKAYKINRLVGELVDGMIQPSLLQSAATESARSYREQLNADIRDKFAAVPAAQRITGLTTSAANFGNPAHQKLIHDTVKKAELSLDYANAPRGNRTRYMVANPQDIQLLQTHLQTQQITYTVLPINEQMIADGVLLRFAGFDIYPDASLGEGNSNTDDAKHTLFFGVYNEGVGFAQQARNLRMVNSEVYAGWLVQGILAHGAVINQPSKVRVALTNIT